MKQLKNEADLREWLRAHPRPVLAFAGAHRAWELGPSVLAASADATQMRADAVFLGVLSTPEEAANLVQPSFIAVPVGEGARYQDCLKYAKNCHIAQLPPRLPQAIAAPAPLQTSAAPSFQHRNDAFTCITCGEDNPPAPRTCRNHCRRCLYSVHIDHHPGDRAASCHGLLRPVSVQMGGKGGFTLHFVCAVCGAERQNRAVADDDLSSFLTHSAGPNSPK